MAQFAQSTEVDTHVKNFGQDVVNVDKVPEVRGGLALYIFFFLLIYYLVRSYTYLIRYAAVSTSNQVSSGHVGRVSS